MVPRLLLAISIRAASARTLVAKVERASDGDPSPPSPAIRRSSTCVSSVSTPPGVLHGHEPGQPFDKEARDDLDHLIGGNTVCMDAYGPDKYRRILPAVWDGQVNVNVPMVARAVLRCTRAHTAKFSASS